MIDGPAWPTNCAIEFDRRAIVARIYARGDVPAIAMAIGAPLGAVIGLAWGEAAMAGAGVALGAGVGLAIGSAIETDLRKKDRVRPLTPEERKQRWRFGIAGVAVGVLLLVAFVVLYLNRS